MQEQETQQHRVRLRQGFALDVYGWVLVVLAAIFSVVVLATADLEPGLPSMGGSAAPAKVEYPSAFVWSEGIVPDSVEAAALPPETYVAVTQDRRAAVTAR